MAEKDRNNSILEEEKHNLLEKLKEYQVDSNVIEIEEEKQHKEVIIQTENEEEK